MGRGEGVGRLSSGVGMVVDRVGVGVCEACEGCDWACEGEVRAGDIDSSCGSEFGPRADSSLIFASSAFPSTGSSPVRHCASVSPPPA